MNTAPWLSVLVASLLGSAHCAGMCGGFVTAYSGEPGESGARRAARHVAYNGGRLLTYLTLGGLAGAFGSAIDLAGRAAGFAHAAAVATGAVLIVSGLLDLSRRSAPIPLGARRARPLAGRVSKLLIGFRSKPALLRAALLGLTTTLLPCGWLYAFVALAAATGSASGGLSLMSAFWLGSLPMMLGVALSAQTVLAKLGGRLPLLRSSLVIGVGAITLLSRLQLPSFAGAEHAHAPNTSVNAALPTSKDCPCHRHSTSAAVEVKPTFEAHEVARPGS